MLFTAREADRPKSVPGKTLIYSDVFTEVYVEVYYREQGSPYPLLRHLQVEHVRRIEIPQERRVVQPPPLGDGLSVTTELPFSPQRRHTPAESEIQEGKVRDGSITNIVCPAACFRSSKAGKLREQIGPARSPRCHASCAQNRYSACHHRLKLSLEA